MANVSITSSSIFPTSITVEETGKTITLTDNTAVSKNIVVDQLTVTETPAALNDITDVNITSLADNQILVYDSATSKWVNEANSASAPVTSVNTQTGAVVLDTDDISEGSTNLYFSGKTTDNLTEGSTNLYYADSLVDAHLTGGTGVTYSAGDISIGQDVATTANPTFNTVTATDEFLGDLDGSIQTTIRNTSGSTIYKGQAVYVTGLSGDTPTVSLARADSASTMPAAGIARTDINDNASGQMTIVGALQGIDTSASNNIETGITLAVNNVLYVSATEAGNVTNVAPTGEGNLIQNLGKAIRVAPNTNMTFSVQGAGRANATPNLNDGNIFIGNASNQVITATLDTSLVPENTNLYYTDARADARIGAASIDDLNDVVITSASTGEVLKYNGANWVNDTDAGGIALTDLSVGTENTASDDGAISYNNTTGVFTYTPPTATGIGALANIVEDTTPQLGGNLDAQSFDITDVGRADFQNASTSSSSTAAVIANANGHGAPAFSNSTGYNLFAGNTLLGRNFSGAYIDFRASAHFGANVQANYTIQTGSFTINTLDCSMHVVDLSGAVTVTFSTTSVNRSNANGALGDSGHIMQYEFYANQDATGGHALSFVKSGGGATVYEYGTQDTASNARQHCFVRVFHANSGGFNAIHVHWGDSV